MKRGLVVGLGSIGRRHLALLQELLPNADIRTLRQSRSSYPEERSAPMFTSLEAASAFKPDFAVISSPAPFHIAVSTRLAAIGAHLLVEKPISTETFGVEKLIALCDSKDVRLQVGYNLRFLPTLQKFRQLISDGFIGTVRTVHSEVGQYLPSWRPDQEYRCSVSAQRHLGGGVLLELSHELDFLRWVFGDVEWISAWSGNQSNLDIDAEDLAMLQLKFMSGVVAQVSMDFFRLNSTRCCVAIGDEGTLRWDAVAARVERFDVDTDSWQIVFEDRPDRNSSYRNQLQSFFEDIRLRRQSDIAASGDDGLAVLQLIEAARLSNTNEGRRISIAGQL